MSDSGRRPRLMPVRHALAVLLLPVTVTVVVPAWILRSAAGGDSRWPPGATRWIPRALGVLLGAAGLALLAWCVALFARVGKGTLAPWDPTSNLVAAGPYRYTRNPMITGVAAILTAEAVTVGSWRLGLWAVVFVAVNHLHFLMVEEPGLDRRFGEPYREYRRRVPRWIPRPHR